MSALGEAILSSSAVEVVVPQLRVGEGLVKACNKVGALDSTTDIISIDGARAAPLPAEFHAKLEFDATKRSQFERHLLARHASGGLAGFGQRLIRAYVALAHVKVERGYGGSVMGLWSQDTVYILGELLCYTDDAMAVRICLALEATFLTDAATEAATDLFGKHLARGCPRLTAALQRDGCFESCMFGLGRQFGGTLLAKGFGGCEVVPLVWKACIEGGCLRPLVGVVVELLHAVETDVLAAYDDGRGLTGIDVHLRRHYDTLSRADVECMVADAAAQHPGSPVVRLQRSPDAGDADWTPMSAPAAACCCACYPLAYGCLPFYARERGPLPLPFAARAALTAALWAAWFAVFHVMLAPAGNAAAYAVPALIATAVVLVPLAPMALSYSQRKEGYTPLVEP